MRNTSKIWLREKRKSIGMIVIGVLGLFGLESYGDYVSDGLAWIFNLFLGGN